MVIADFGDGDQPSGRSDGRCQCRVSSECLRRVDPMRDALLVARMRMPVVPVGGARAVQGGVENAGPATAVWSRRRARVFHPSGRIHRPWTPTRPARMPQARTSVTADELYTPRFGDTAQGRVVMQPPPPVSSARSSSAGVTGRATRGEGRRAAPGRRSRRPGSDPRSLRGTTLSTGQGWSIRWRRGRCDS